MPVVPAGAGGAAASGRAGGPVVPPPLPAVPVVPPRPGRAACCRRGPPFPSRPPRAGGACRGAAGGARRGMPAVPVAEVPAAPVAECRRCPSRSCRRVPSRTGRAGRAGGVLPPLPIVPAVPVEPLPAVPVELLPAVPLALLPPEPGVVVPGSLFAQPPTTRKPATRARDHERVKGFMVRCMSSVFNRRGAGKNGFIGEKTTAEGPQSGHSVSGESMSQRITQVGPLVGGLCLAASWPVASSSPRRRPATSINRARSTRSRRAR